MSFWVFVQMTKPVDFASQINLKMDNCWGIIRAMVDLCLKQPEGKYLLLKDPNKPIIRLYEVSAWRGFPGKVRCVV